jgi:uncharacterized protein YceK
MKKLMVALLGLSLLSGVATVSFAQNAPKKEEKKKKAKKSKKKADKKDETK